MAQDSSPQGGGRDPEARIAHLEWALDTVATSIDLIVSEISDGSRTSLDAIRMDLAGYSHNARVWRDGP